MLTTSTVTAFKVLPSWEMVSWALPSLRPLRMATTYAACSNRIQTTWMLGGTSDRMIHILMLRRIKKSIRLRIDSSSRASLVSRCVIWRCHQFCWISPRSLNRMRHRGDRARIEVPRARRQVSCNVRQTTCNHLNWVIRITVNSRNLLYQSMETVLKMFPQSARLRRNTALRSSWGKPTPATFKTWRKIRRITMVGLTDLRSPTCRQWIRNWWLCQTVIWICFRNFILIRKSRDRALDIRNRPYRRSIKGLLRIVGVKLTVIESRIGLMVDFRCIITLRILLMVGSILDWDIFLTIANPRVILVILIRDREEVMYVPKFKLMTRANLNAENCIRQIWTYWLSSKTKWESKRWTS